MYQGLDYNGEFRKFFSGLFTKYAVSDAGDRDLLHEIARDFVEANRDFVMQYPLVSYWSERSPEEIYTDLEQRLAEPYEGQKVNLYFHIPFCKTRCTYCNFHIVTGEGRIRAAEKLYLHMMLREARLFRDRLDSLQVETCFIGGGTPSYLSEEGLRTLLTGIRDIFGADFQPHTEYTFEGNPDSYTPEKMEILREF